MKRLSNRQRDGALPQVRAVARRALPIFLVLVLAACAMLRPASAARTPSVPARQAARPASAAVLTRAVDSLRREVDRSSVLTATPREADRQRLRALDDGLARAASLERQAGARAALLRALDARHAAAIAGIDRLRSRVQDDLSAVDQALTLGTEPVSATAQTTEMSATVSITQARLELQTQTSQLTLNVQTGIQLLSVLALDSRAFVGTQRLSGQFDVLAQQTQVGLNAVLADLRVVQASDPSAVADAENGLAEGLTQAINGLSDSLLGSIDAKRRLLDGEISQLRNSASGLLDEAALNLAAARQAVVAAEIATAPLTSGQRADAMGDLDRSVGALRGAADASARLAARLDDLATLQGAQARIDRDVQRAQSDLDRDMARSEAALQGQLRADVTVAISDTEETIHVHLDTLDVGALVRDLDFNVNMGIAVLHIAALHAEVTPGSGGAGGTTAHIQGVDMELHARIEGLQAQIRTDVAAARTAQDRLSAAVHARMDSLRQSANGELTPAIDRYQTDVAGLQQTLNDDLAAATSHTDRADARMLSVFRLVALRGDVTADKLSLRQAPATSSAVVAWAHRGTTLHLVGYVWGWSVRDPSTGATDDRWYVLRDPTRPDARAYLYVPAALLATTHARVV